MIFPIECQVKENKFFKWYNSLMNKAKLRVFPENTYKERHHVIPRCLGVASEVLKLTAREHFVAHLLLIKFVENEKFRQKLLYALWGMCNQKSKNQERQRVSSRLYEKVKVKFVNSISGEKHWMKDPERRRKFSEKCKGRKVSEATKAKLSRIFKGRECEWKDKIGLANKGKKRSEEMNNAQSIRMKEGIRNGTVKTTLGVIQKKAQCPFCKKMVNGGNMRRWHGLNCRSRPQS